MRDGEEDRSKGVAERVYDMEDETIKLKFHREKDRILRDCSNYSINIYILIIYYLFI